MARSAPSHSDNVYATVSITARGQNTSLTTRPPTGVVGDWRGAASVERDRERPDASGAHSTREVFELPGGIPLPKDYTPYPPPCELCSRGSLSVSTMLSDSAQFTDGRQKHKNP